jgi:hypothetical protein
MSTDDRPFNYRIAWEVSRAASGGTDRHGRAGDHSLERPVLSYLPSGPMIMSADQLLDGPLDPMPDAFEATSRCS